MPCKSSPRSTSCEERECTSGRRNRYFVGKRLMPDAFQVEQDYFVERRRLLNRSIHGWGIVHGYAISVQTEGDDSVLKIGPGLALDRCGRELVQIDKLVLSYADLICFDDNGKLVRGQTAGSGTKFDETDQKCVGSAPPEGCWLLRVHYAEEDIGPLMLRDAYSCERRSWDQVCETVRYSLEPWDCTHCCDDQPCELECGCATGGCYNPPSEAKETDSGRNLPDRPESAPRGGRCLCDHLTKLSGEVECSALCTLEDGLRVDLHNGVALACVSLRQNECKRQEFGSVIETCGPRRLVKRNDLLFDLIRGCDLTHIHRISWANWHRSGKPVPWEDFAKMFKCEAKGDCVTGFSVEFSRPVRKVTLTPDCIVMTVISREVREDGWGEVMRVPITGLDYLRPFDEPPGCVGGATLIVDRRWASEIVGNGYTKFDRDVTWVEIEVRGDFILDCNGQPLDVNARGLDPVPTGNGTPGGTYLSTFRVDRKPGKAYDATNAQ